MLSSDRLALLAAATLLGAGCFPTFPDEGALKNLRIVAMQQDPAVLLLDGTQLPRVTVRSLTVDPVDQDLEATTHTWTLDLPDDFEGAEFLEELVPDGPYSEEVALDFGALLAGGARDEDSGARDSIEPPQFLPTDYTAGLLPLTYTAENDELVREGLKFVDFLVPDFENLPTPSFDPPWYRPSVEYAEALAERAAEGPPEGWNANPNFTKIIVNQGEQEFEAFEVPGLDEALDIGTIAPGEGLRIDVEIEDDKEADSTDVDFYWTHGTPGLPVEADEGPGGFGGGDSTSGAEPAEGEPEAQDGEGFGGGAGLSEAFEPDRAFGWTAPALVRQGPIRLFVVARDGEGGVAWQELRVTLEE